MKVTLQLLASTIGAILFMGVILFVPAGTFDYWQAWVFIAVFIVGTMAPTVYLAVKYPEALRRRMTSGPWSETRLVQKLITVGISLSVVAVGVIGSLDHRFGWSTVPTAAVVVGDVLVLAGLGLAELVVVQNNYAAATITVEAEQPVVEGVLVSVREARTPRGAPQHREDHVEQGYAQDQQGDHERREEEPRLPRERVVGRCVIRIERSRPQFV